MSRVCPIFMVSNITGEGLDLLKMFLNTLQANSLGTYDIKAPVEFQITGDNLYNIVSPLLFRLQFF